MRLTPKFEDVHPAYDGGTTFYVTNEAGEIFRDMLAGKRFQRGAGIASAGEMPLFMLLPLCDEVVSVDHTYGSLAMAYAKALLLRDLGAEGCKALLLEKSFQEFIQALNTIRAEMPEVLQKHLYTTPAYQYSGLTYSQWSDIRREWAIIPLTLMKRTRRRLSKLTFIHGDIRDLKGPFDVLYVSNAFDKNTRTGKCATAAEVVPLLKEEGLLLTTNIGGCDKAPLTRLRSINNTRQTGVSWTYSVYQRQKQEAAAIVAEAVTQAPV